MPDAATTPPPAIHLHPTAPLAERVLLPGDPGRALALAQLLLEQPKMFNHNRGLWGYTGDAFDDGLPLTIQSTGMGGPSAAIVLEELLTLGAQRAIRVGTCGALDRTLVLGDLVVAREAICADGASRALAGGERVAADPTLTDALAQTAPAARVGAVVSVDLFYERDGARSNVHSDALAVEMEAATLLAIGATAHVPVGCVLAVTDTFADDGARTRIEPHVLHDAAERLGRVALAALGSTPAAA